MPNDKLIKSIRAASMFLPGADAEILEEYVSVLKENKIYVVQNLMLALVGAYSSKKQMLNHLYKLEAHFPSLLITELDNETYEIIKEFQGKDLLEQNAK
jgi:hypothetical protein